MQNFKVMVIGLDGATFDLIRPWAEQGRLPTFQRLMAGGSAGFLRSTIPPMTAPAWSSFMTGKNPGKHGLYDWVQRRPESYQFSPVTAQHCREPALWDLLGQAGKRVCMLNIPMTFPPKPVNGLMISGMPAPSTRVEITYPPELFAELEQAVGPYLLYPDPGQAYSDSGVDAFLKRLYQTTETRLQVMDYLRRREPWDFFMLVFNGTDTIQHAMWKYMSPAHPLHDPARFDKYGGEILRYHRFLDEAIGKLVADLDEDTVLMFMSDHGFGPFHKFIHVNNWLMQQGWLKVRRNLGSQAKAAAFRLGFAPMKVYDLLMRLGFGSLKREVVRGRGQGLLKTLFLSFDDLDWPRTLAYSLGNVGQIRLNVAGREPQGVVEPGEPYDALREEIMARLWGLRDPVTGEQVVQEIYRREEIYQGPNLDLAADIVFIPTRMEYFGFGEYEFGSNEIIESMKRGISGTHRMNGMFLLYGRPVEAGIWYEGAAIVDLAPTIMHLLDQEIPPDMDGKVLVDLLKPDYRQVRLAAARSGPAGPTDQPGEGGGLSDEEQEVILERMRSLGYTA